MEYNPETRLQNECPIRVKAMCLILRDGAVLAAKGKDEKKGIEFYRVVGGSLDHSEHSLAGVKREIMEELGSELENLELVDVVENIFMYRTAPGHEITFLYKGDLVNKELYTQDVIEIVEPYGTLQAYWIPLADVISGKTIVYPEWDYSKIAL